MDSQGINWPLVAAQLLNLVIVIAWLVFACIALRHLCYRHLGEGARALWAACIILVPVLGAVAFLIVRPGTAQ